MPAVYENLGLFSRHYLENLLRQRPEWSAATEAALAAREALRALYKAHQKTLAKQKEQALEQTWIRPVLELLGVAFDVQPALPTEDPGRTLSPDYVMFESAEALHAARALQQSGARRDFFAAGRLIGDAKRWGVDFNLVPKGERSPRQQLTEYLHLSQINWGLLTDGRYWRLTHRSVAGRLDHYYQVDLVAALESESLDDFLYFFLFFNGGALRPSSDGAPTFLDAVRTGSTQYAEAVGEELVESVYEALRLLGKGFVARAGPEILADPELLRRECLTLLYRLLFGFYAEHRHLLPLGDPRYADASLTRVASDVAKALDAGTGFLSRRTGLWGRLANLFELIDRGDEELGVPAYNGGLFNAKEHPLLAKGGPGDRDLAAAIDLLARTHAPKAAERHFIDYRDLDIRHLGSIYERLLEYRLEVAATDLAIVPGDEKKKTEKYVPFDAEKHGALPDAKRVAKGDTYLVTDRGERHTSGSFYTPDFIVEHLVERTLAPLVKGRTPAEILQLRVVDTAMGSGHFLLGAVDYLAQAYADAQVAQAVGDVETSEAELLTYRRLVAERCIYGVDLNRMAVELAKLGLWLKTMAKDSALTFLNHNLKDGNSLLGCRAEEIGVHRNGNGKNGRKPGTPAQLDMFQRVFQQKLPTMIDDALKILALKTHSREDVEAKEQWDAAIEEIRAPFLLVAGVQSAGQLGVKPADFDNLLLRLNKPQTVGEHPDVIAAEEVARTRRFFHWELMFPEVFFDKFGQRRADSGFDAVLGNPPWVRQETLKRDKEALKALYPEVYDGVADIYVFFAALGLRVLAPHGRMGLVLPNKWFRADYAEKLRELLPKASHPESLVDFGHAPIFNEADTFPCLLVVDHDATASGDLQFCAVPREQLDGLNLPRLFDQKAYPVSPKMLRAEGWYPHPPAIAKLMEKLWKRPRLKEVVGSEPYYGVKTGLNEAFLIDQATRDGLVKADPTCDSVIKKYVRGEDLERWSPRWGGEWMIALASSENKDWPWSTAGNPEHAFEETYPSLFRRMKAQQSKLENREDQGRHWWELRSCDYYDKFEQEKILYQEIQFHSRFSIDREGLYLNNKCFFLAADDLGLLASLNSALMSWYMWHTAPRMKDEAFALQGFYMENLPIVRGGQKEAKSLVAHTKSRRTLETTLLDWLRLSIGLQKVSDKLASFWQLSEVEFLAELKKAGLKLSKADTQRVREEFASTTKEYLPLLGKTRALERQLHQAVFEAYELTAKEIKLVRETASPRDPLTLLDEGA
jgi:hypothetical protein